VLLVLALHAVRLVKLWAGLALASFSGQLGLGLLREREYIDLVAAIGRGRQT